MWLCVCRLPNGTVETTEWITQDGADQMASETEAEWRRKRKRAVCQVAPCDAPDAEACAAAVAEILADEEDHDE